MRRVLVSMVVLLALIGLTASMAQAAEYPIDYVLKNGPKLANRIVTVRGVVANSQAVTPGPLSKIKGEYDLTDSTGTMHVRTTASPPANGVARTVKATVDVGEAVPLLLERPGIPWMLYGALALLVVLAIVLLVLLIARPAPAPVMMPMMPAMTGPPAGVLPVVPSPAARTTGTSRSTVAMPGQEVRSSQKPTVQIPTEPKEQPLADLTVVEGEGAKYGTKFVLRKERQKLGRREDMDIRLADETVSREHASIWWQDGSFYIQDEASASGTMVNGQKITRQSLSDNDTVEIGRTKLIFRILPGTMGAQ